MRPARAPFSLSLSLPLSVSLSLSLSIFFHIYLFPSLSHSLARALSLSLFLSLERDPSVHTIDASAQDLTCRHIHSFDFAPGLYQKHSLGLCKQRRNDQHDGPARVGGFDGL